MSLALLHHHQHQSITTIQDPIYQILYLYSTKPISTHTSHWINRLSHEHYHHHNNYTLQTNHVTNRLSHCYQGCCPQAVLHALRSKANQQNP